MALVPDTERVVSDYLRSDPGVAAFTTSVRGSDPDTTDQPWVKVLQYDGSQIDTPDHLALSYLQLDCYAGKIGGQPEAVDLARAVRAALVEIHHAAHDNAVVTGARIDGFHRERDPSLTDEDGKDRQRVIIQARVWAHSV